MKKLATACHAWILTLAFATGTIVAQERRPLVGTVVDAQGQPAADTTVTLVWSPPGGPDCGATDVVTAPTDARGRFLARLLAQESYSAWAVRTDDANDGTAEVSRCHDGIAAGGSLELRLHAPARPQRVQLEGTEPYAAIGPLHVEAAADAANFAFHPVGADGLAPPLPPIGWVLVRDAKGEPLWMNRVQTAPNGQIYAIGLPPLLRTRLLVQDAHGAPLAGARVFVTAAPTTAFGHDLLPMQRTAGEILFERPAHTIWRCAGTTGADGTIEVSTPRVQPGFTELAVRKAGFAECVVQRIPDQEQSAYVGGSLQPAVAGQFVVPLRPAARLRIVVGGAPPGPTTARLTASYRGAISCERAVALQLDEQGACEVPLPSGPTETMLHVRRAADATWQLLRVPFSGGETTTVDLGWQRELDLQCLDAAGGPARGLTGVLVAIGTEASRNQQVVIGTDQAGRLQRTVGTDAWLLLLTDGASCYRYDVPGIDAEHGRKPLRGQLRGEPMAQARFRIVDLDARPLGGVLVPGLNFIIGAAGDAVHRTEQRVLLELARHLVNRAVSTQDGELLVRWPAQLRGQMIVLLRNPATNASTQHVLRSDTTTEVTMPRR